MKIPTKARILRIEKRIGKLQLAKELGNTED